VICSNLKELGRGISSARLQRVGLWYRPQDCDCSEPARR